MIRKLLVLLLVLAVAATAGLYGAVQVALSPVSEEAVEPVVFVVPGGASVRRIARSLESEGLVRDARAVEALARLRELQPRTGEYELAASMTPEAILERLDRGEVVTYEVVLPEGWRATEIAARLEAADLADSAAFLAVVNDPAVPKAFGVEGRSLEGYLFPETYRFPRGLPPREIARAMVEQFLTVWQGIEPGASAIGFGMQQTVTLASIVEKETGAPHERPLIASVFHNRLAKRMRLETDPTVIYGIPDFDGNLRRVHLEDRSNPYNTYRIKGLPPGPIANPGTEALRAVIEPADSDYLYFVSKNDGTHTFSKTYREHVAAVNRYQRRGRR